MNDRSSSAVPLLYQRPAPSTVTISELRPPNPLFRFVRTREGRMPLPFAVLERVTVSCATPLYTRSLVTSAHLRAAAAGTPKPKQRPPKDPKAQFYSQSLNLPTTPFPLRAGAGKREKLFWRRTTDELYSWQVSDERPLSSDAGSLSKCMSRLSKRRDRCSCCMMDRLTPTGICTLVSSLL